MVMGSGDVGEIPDCSEDFSFGRINRGGPQILLSTLGLGPAFIASTATPGV